MFQYPGLQQKENLKDEVQELRRWLARFVPELEQQLDNLGADNFTTAYNERLEGVTTLSGAGKQKTTSEALAEHLLDTNNPHKTSLFQLGFSWPVYTETTNGWSLVFGGIMLQAKTVQLDQHSGTAQNNIYRSDVTIGDWDTEFDTLFSSWAQVHAEGARTQWTGTIWGADKTSAGTVRLLCSGGTYYASDVTIFGIGRAKSDG